jgi:CARDB
MRRLSTWIVVALIVVALVAVGGIILKGPSPKMPDLIVSAIVVDCSTGSPAVSAMITNNGPAAIDVGKSWTEELVMMHPASSSFPSEAGGCSNSANWCSWSSPNASWVMPANTPAPVTLKKGDSVSVHLGPPPHIPSAWNQYDLEVVVDPLNRFPEGNENNNVNQTIIKPCA